MIPTKTRQHALIIGNSSYENSKEFPTLKYASKDAKRVFSMLTESKTSIFTKKASTYKLNVCSNSINDLLVSFMEPVHSNDLVLFYFAGHARVIPGSKSLFLILADTTPGRLAGTAFNIDRLIPFFEEKGLSRYIVVLDCCRAGRALKSPGIQHRGTIENCYITDNFSHGKVFVASAHEYELAHELDSLEHGMFTFYFVKGIETGDACDSSKEWITITDIHDYIQTMLKKEHPDISQVPVMSGSDVVGQLRIAKNIRFLSDRAYAAEILEYIKKSLNLSDLSDEEKVKKARITKLRAFIEELYQKVKEHFSSLKYAIVQHGEALGLESSTSKKEFDDFCSMVKFNNAYIPEEITAKTSGHGRALLFSTAYGTFALESPELGSGLFSYHFGEALRGRAANKDGVVTLTSAFDYLQFHVHGYEHHVQKPVIVSNMASDPILTAEGINWKNTSGKRVAIIIGVNRYMDISFPDLRYAESDVKMIADILQKLGGFECYQLCGEIATQSRVNKVVFEMLQQLGHKDFLIIYFTGHGYSMEEDGFAVLYDSNRTDVTLSLRVTGLVQALESSAIGTALVVLDTCMAPAQLPHFSLMVNTHNEKINVDLK